jgi:hypothetical protein
MWLFDAQANRPRYILGDNYLGNFMARTHSTNTRSLVHNLDRTYRGLSNSGQSDISNQFRNEFAALGGGSYRPRYGNHRKMMAEQKVRLRRTERRRQNQEPLETE